MAQAESFKALEQGAGIPNTESTADLATVDRSACDFAATAQTRRWADQPRNRRRNISMRLIILGAPGSGKGTQATRLAKHFAIMHLSTGDLLRAAVNEGSVPGLAANETVIRGGLVPDPVVIEIVRDQVLRPEAQDGFILDGFPRTVNQAIALDHMLSDSGMRLDAVVELKTDEAVLADRMARVAAARSEEVRKDDNPETLAVRLKAYRKQTFPLVEYYRRIGLLMRVDGSMPVDVVSTRILDLTESLLPI
jgi:adenylate kinase